LRSSIRYAFNKHRLNYTSGIDDFLPAYFVASAVNGGKAPDNIE